MSEYKLTYFNFRGWGEAARLIFHYSNVDFVDNRIEFAEWPELKPSFIFLFLHILETPFGQLPYLTLNGTVEIAQAFAIFRLLGNRFGLAGKNDVESAQIDALGDLYKEFTLECLPYLFVAGGRNAGDKNKLYNEQFLPASQKYLPFLKKALKESGNGYFMASGICWLDFVMASGMIAYNNLAPDALKNYPEILEHSKRVHALPQLQAYLSTRLQTVY